MACRILPWLLLSAAGLITVSADEFADAVFAAIDTRNDGLREINREIWENPELAFEEVHAHEVLTTFLEEQGFNVTRSAYNLSTAFVAEFSNGEGRAVSFNAEYDALPGIGHSCGHNLIATASVSAAIGVKEALQNQGIQGRVVLLGTPAEEGGGGKVKLLEAGAYDGLSCSLMAHPGNANYASYAPSMAAWTANVTWEGYASHAAGSPWLGRNAMDAFVAAYSMSGLYRQQLRPEDRIHHVVSSGGQLSNVIPDHVESIFGVRSSYRPRRDVVIEQVKSILYAATNATNTSVTIEDTLDYWDQNPSMGLTGAYYRYHMEYFNPSEDTLTANFSDPTIEYEIQNVVRGGSSDQGNVSWKLPAIQTGFPVGGEYPVHNAGFREVAGTDFAHDQAVIAGKTLAMTALDILRNETFAIYVYGEWKAMIAELE